MKPVPGNFPRITPSLHSRNAAKHIDFLCDAFGFELRLRVDGEGGRVEHSELTYGEGVVMVCDEKKDTGRFGADYMSPLTAGSNTQSLMVYVDDVDAHCAHAKARGAKITDPPTVHDYGDDYWSDRSYGALDPEGHSWWFTQRLRSPK